MVLNIELKGPNDPAFKPRYDFEAASRIVYEMILETGIATKVMLSSFQPEILSSMKAVSADNRQFMIHRLTSDKGEPDPYDYQMHDSTEGINMYHPYVSKAVTQKIRDQGGFVGVWWSAKVQTENKEMYDLVMS